MIMSSMKGEERKCSVRGQEFDDGRLTGASDGKLSSGMGILAYEQCCALRD